MINKQQAEEQIVDGEVAFDEDLMRELRQMKEDSAGPGATYTYIYIYIYTIHILYIHILTYTIGMLCYM
jgi:hypothetical protein